MFVCIHLRTYVHTYILVCVCVCVSALCVFMRVCVCVPTNIYIISRYIIYTFVSSHVHIHSCGCKTFVYVVCIETTRHED